MPAKDRFHDAVRRALEKDGWTITHDPFTVSVGRREDYMDVGAERVMAAEKGTERIVVEIKSFGGPSDLQDLERAIGQYVFYRIVLQEVGEDRTLYAAVPTDAYDGILSEPIARPAVEGLPMLLLVFDPEQEEIVRWVR
jgi:hypothetical protein